MSHDDLTRYGSKDAAVAAARDQQEWGVLWRVWQCDHCGGWHAAPREEPTDD